MVRRAPWWVCCWAALALCDLPQGLGQLPQINPDGLTSAAICGECHQAIHAVWQHSLHANAWTNSVFQAGYQRTLQIHGPEDARLCVSCHAPTVRHTNDYELQQAITAEGVTCDFCHSVAGVNLENHSNPFVLDVGKVKYGPLRRAQSPTHEVATSELHTQSEFCATCHEYRNRHGLTVLGTYSEWKASPYAQRGVQCQECHMPLVPGRVVSLSVKEDTQTSVNLHDISGSHDLEQVRKAVQMQLLGVDWIADRVWVNLEVINSGSGHCFPTGLPLHRAVLEVVLRESGREIARREVPFHMELVDQEGRRIQREHDVFLKAARVQIDTRLRPQERRRVEVAFRDIDARRPTMSATLFYEYATETLVTRDGRQHIEPTEMKFAVATAQKTLKKLQP